MREGTITVTASLGKAGATIKKVNHMELSFFLSVFLFCTTFSCGIPGRGAFSQRNAVVGGRLLPGFADELSIRGGKKTLSLHPQLPLSMNHVILQASNLHAKTLSYDREASKSLF